MKWTDNLDKMLLNEIVLYQPWNYKARSEERTLVWTLIAESPLNNIENTRFQVTARGVRG